MTVQPIPSGYETITPYLIIRGAAKAIDFYKQAFGAMEKMRMAMPDGRIGHADLTIDGSNVMLADEMPEMDIKGPQSLGGSSVGLLLYVEDVDARFDRAIKAGATVKRPVADQFYGDRAGTVVDPFGHQWTLASRKENVSPAEMDKRMAKAVQSMCQETT